MRFLIDASLPRPTADLIRTHGHEASDVRDIGLGTAPDSSIAAHAKANGLCLITRDNDFGNVVAYPPREFAGIVVIQAPHHARRSTVLSLVERFLREAELIARLPGRLALVDVWRIRVRPL